MENKPLRSRMSFLWILRVVYFPVKHACLYNKYKSKTLWDVCENDFTDNLLSLYERQTFYYLFKRFSFSSDIVGNLVYYERLSYFYISKYNVWVIMNRKKFIWLWFLEASGVNPKPIEIFILWFCEIIWVRISRWIPKGAVTLEQDKKKAPGVLVLRYKRSSLGNLLSQFLLKRDLVDIRIVCVEGWNEIRPVLCF